MKNLVSKKWIKAEAYIRRRVIDALKEGKAIDLSYETLSRCLMGKIFGSRLMSIANIMVMQDKITMDDLKN